MIWLAAAKMVIMTVAVLWYNIVPGKEDDWWLGL